MKFEPNPLFEQEIKHDLHYRTLLYNVATVVRNNAEIINRTIHAPWMPRKRLPIEVRQLDETLVVNTDYAAAITEWGGVTRAGYVIPAWSPLRIGVWTAGLRFAPDPKDAVHRVIPY